jgi:hypothetical protein
MVRELRELTFCFDKLKMYRRDLPHLAQSNHLVSGGGETTVPTN